MRIGIDARGRQKSLDGIGRYTRNLITALLDNDSENEYVIFALPDVNWSCLDKYSNARLFHFPHRHLSMATINQLGPLVDQEKVEIFHSLFFVAPKKMKARLVLTVHDLMALTYPGFFGERFVGGQVLASLYHRMYVTQSVERADAIVAVSDFTRTQLREHLRAPEEKIHVIFNMVDSHFTTDHDPEADLVVLGKYGIEKDYFLYVGNTKPYKNIEGLLRGYARYKIKCSEKNVPLIMVGKEDRFRKRAIRIAQTLKIGNMVRFIGEVEDEDLPAIMRQALVLTQPSHMEGFGLPALEALACGTPVVASKASALSEVLGRSALTFPSDENTKLGECLCQLVEQPQLREKLSQEGARRAVNFRKEPIAKQVLQLYRKVAQGKV